MLYAFVAMLFIFFTHHLYIVDLTSNIEFIERLYWMNAIFSFSIQTHNHFRVQANLPWPKFKESQISKPPHKIYILKTQHEATRKKTRAVFFLVFGFRLAETNNKQVNSFSIIHLIGSKQWTMQTSGKPTTTTGLYR